MSASSWVPPSSPSPSSIHPAYLDPSELGTKNYWDAYYNSDLTNINHTEQNNNDASEPDDKKQRYDEGPVPDPSDLPSWFDDVGAPSKILSYLTSTKFPLSPSQWPPDGPLPCVLDLGTGNGSLLFLLRTEGDFIGNRMCGIDYSQSSIKLSKNLRQDISQGCEDIEFETCDILRDDFRSAEWWPQDRHGDDGWDLVLDKGTFDAISLSAEEIESESSSTGRSRRRRICELYPMIVTEMVKVGGFLLITSCNWTEEEVIRWFRPPSLPGSVQESRSEGGGARLEVYGKVTYSKFKFGGQEGQGVVSICFKRVS